MALNSGYRERISVLKACICLVVGILQPSWERSYGARRVIRTST